MLAVKKEQAVEALRGHEVWFNSYLKSCCTSMARVCRELKVVRGDPDESAAGYISWLNGACAQLDGIGKRIDEALKQECRRSSRYAGGMYWLAYEIIVRSCTSSSSAKGFVVLGELLRR